MSIERKTIKPVSVVPYDERWPTTFTKEADRLLSVLRPESASLHHIGSTSVPGLCAKPVIDMLIEAPDLATVECATPLSSGEDTWPRGSMVSRAVDT